MQNESKTYQRSKLSLIADISTVHNEKVLFRINKLSGLDLRFLVMCLHDLLGSVFRVYLIARHSKLHSMLILKQQIFVKVYISTFLSCNDSVSDDKVPTEYRCEFMNLGCTFTGLISTANIGNFLLHNFMNCRA